MPEPPAEAVTNPKPKSAYKYILLVAALLSVAVIAGGAALFMPRTGGLKIYVSDSDGQDIGPVDIFVDNAIACTSSPCSVMELPPGIHDVYAKAAGYAPAATKGVEIAEGRDSKFEIELFSAATGFRVAAGHPGIVLHVDGKEIGPLPQTLESLRAGEHILRFVGSERYASKTKTVSVIANQVVDLGEIKLDVVRGLATFEFVTPGVRMRLVPSEGDARAIDAAKLENGRLSVDIDTSKEWKLEACSVGYDFFELPISFADGLAEKTFKVELTKNDAIDAKKLESWCRPTHSGMLVKAIVSEPGGTLNFNSIPPGAAVVLDGRPVGRTPASGVQVSAGDHNVVFIHPDKGRKSASVTVKAGESRGVGVRF